MCNFLQVSDLVMDDQGSEFQFQPFHTGLSCDIKREIECLEDKKLKSWIQEQPKKRKMCPTCKSGIEKQMGCSNVHCASCHTFICWLCLKVSEDYVNIT